MYIVNWKHSNWFLTLADLDDNDALRWCWWRQQGQRELSANRVHWVVHRHQNKPTMFRRVTLSRVKGTSSDMMWKKDDEEGTMPVGRWRTNWSWWRTGLPRDSLDIIALQQSRMSPQIVICVREMDSRNVGRWSLHLRGGVLVALLTRIWHSNNRAN